MDWILKFLNRYRFYRSFIGWTTRIILPGFNGLPLYTVSVFFYNELKKEALFTKASSLAFNFLLAIFPFIIFLFTLIPLIPIPDFQARSEEHTSELQSLMRISYAVFCLKKKKTIMKRPD